jgi:hypothetical protein
MFAENFSSFTDQDPGLPPNLLNCLFLVPHALLMYEDASGKIDQYVKALDRLCGLVVRVLGYRFGSPCSIPGTTRKKSSGSATGSTQPREYN